MFEVKMKRSFIFLLVFLIIIISGCESVRKKFIRKRKEPERQEEMILVPQDYSKQRLPADIAYLNYYNYWKSWHTELLQFMQEGSNFKKVKTCFEQVLLNLERMKEILTQQKAEQLAEYISKIKQLEIEFEDDFKISINLNRIRSKLEGVLNDINKHFSFSKVKNNLEWK